MKRYQAIILTATLTLGFATLGVSNIITTNNKLKLKEIHNESQTTEINLLKVKRIELNTNLNKLIEEKDIDKEKIQELEKENIELEQKQTELESKLQAKLDAENRTPLSAPVAFAATEVSGNKASWLKASGIDESNWWAVDYIVRQESGWNPCKYYPGKENCNLTAEQINATCSTYVNGQCGAACGLGQSLPCGKWGNNWTDPVNQLKQMNIYVQKFGGWAGAVEYWKANGHY